MIFFTLWTFAEAALINTVINAADLPNFPDPTTAYSHFSGQLRYQRPYSFRGERFGGGVIVGGHVGPERKSFLDQIFGLCGRTCG